MRYGQVLYEVVDFGRSVFNGFYEMIVLVEVFEYVFLEGRFVGCFFFVVDF